MSIFVASIFTDEYCELVYFHFLMQGVCSLAKICKK